MRKNKHFLFDDLNEVADFEDFIIKISKLEIDEKDLPNEIYILPLIKGMFLPKVLFPMHITRPKTLEFIKNIAVKEKYFGAVLRKNEKAEDPTFKDLYKYGTLVEIIRIIKTPDDNEAPLLFGVKRFKIEKIITEKPYLRAQVKYLNDTLPKKNDPEVPILINTLQEQFSKYLDFIPNIVPEIKEGFNTINDLELLTNIIIGYLDLENDKKIALLRLGNIKNRAKKLIEFFYEAIEKQKIKYDIFKKVQKSLDQQQREYILQQQLKTIQQELGTDPLKQDIENLKAKAKKKKWPKKVQQIFEKELARLEKLHQASPEYGMQYNYLQTLLELPWNHKTKDNYDLQRAKEILDEDHYGLEKVKERILEYLAVLKLNKGNLKSPILCLYGPPGVGKTSLGKSIARALNRKYVRMSLGGLHDEAEIRGHRRTYIGAMPGRILQNLKKAKSSNPVFVLDEIDKIGHDFRGDPASALLEVLDPEQNNSFYDNYLEIEYDLSDVLFIATANTISTIHPALLDRMELIEVSGYLLEEKIEIAKRHLIPKLLKSHGLKKTQVIFSDEVLKFIIENYTKESGVRELEKQIAAVLRKIAKKIAFGQKRNPELTTDDIRQCLGAPKFFKSQYEEPQIAGVVPGLAWTPVGGELLYVESSISRGNGKLTITGNVGDVMKESAIIAFEYVKAHYEQLKLHPLIFKFWNVHLHIPEGAIPKDGPSAGITMATALSSLFTQRKVKPYLAMTGELTLSGKVLPVGGIKEKILAAKRAGIKEIILSEKNKNDVEEIKDIYRKDLIFHYVKNMDEVIQIALLDQKVDKPLKIGIPKSALKSKIS